MPFDNQMGNLRTLLDDTQKKTKAAVKETKKDAHDLCRETRAIIKQMGENQKVNAKIVREELRNATTQLGKKVGEMRAENIGKQRQLHREIAQGQAIFWGKQKKEEEKKGKKEPA